MTQNESDHLRIFMPSRLALLIVTALFIGMVLRPASTMAQDYFDPQALEMNALDQDAIDLERFSSHGGQLPGTYRVDIYLN
ncbi:hypothetical protein KIN12_02005, partial [Vibrio cholerae]|nr:hypothetical protein [Vibrio cholerae]